MKMSIVLVRGVFKDIYFWGKGWKDNETYRKFKEAERNIKSYFWNLHKSDDGMSSDYLVSVDGSVYLHPMDFSAVLHRCGSSEDSFACGDLKRICEEIAAYCGGSFEMEVSKPMEVEAEMFEYVKGIHNTL